MRKYELPYKNANYVLNRISGSLNLKKLKFYFEPWFYIPIFQLVRWRLFPIKSPFELTGGDLFQQSLVDLLG